MWKVVLTPKRAARRSNLCETPSGVGGVKTVRFVGEDERLIVQLVSKCGQSRGPQRAVLPQHVRGLDIQRDPALLVRS